MVFHFDVQASALADGSTEACLQGASAVGAIHGCDVVRLIK